MSRIEGIFERLAAEQRTALVTYLVAGDPSPAATLPAMQALVAGGADLIELGVPFSDPEADGPDIQAGHQRALARRTRLVDVLETVRRFRAEDDRTGILLMGYLNSVERMGVERFAESAAAAGVDGLILVNLPPEEAEDLRAALRAREIDLVFLIAPTTTDERARSILDAASGFVYYVSLKGITGAGNLDAGAVGRRLEVLRGSTDLPLAVGFGIRDGRSARAIADVGADAVVVGSAVVRRMGQLADAGEADLGELQAHLREVAAEIRGALDAPERG